MLIALQVVNHERPDLQEGAIQLVKQLAAYTIDLKQLEDSLLARLAASQVCGHSKLLVIVGTNQLGHVGRHLGRYTLD